MNKFMYGMHKHAYIHLHIYFNMKKFIRMSISKILSQSSIRHRQPGFSRKGRQILLAECLHEQLESTIMCTGYKYKTNPCSIALGSTGSAARERKNKVNLNSVVRKHRVREKD